MDYLELNDYLMDFEEYREMNFEDKSTVCILVYNDYSQFALLKDIYLISDYVIDEREGIEYIINSLN